MSNSPANAGVTDRIAEANRQSEQDASLGASAVPLMTPDLGPYSHSVYQSIREVDQDEWNSLRDASRDVFMDPRFIEAVENSLTDCRYRHVLVRDGSGRPIGNLASLSSFVLDGASLTQGASRKLFELVGRVVPWFVRSKLILCGLPVSAGQSHVRFAPRSGPGNRAADHQFGSSQVRVGGIGAPDHVQGN